jgi:DNA repair protein RadC
MELLIKEIKNPIPINNAECIYKNYLKKFGNQDREHFIVIGLDTKNKPLYREIVSIGTLNSTIIHPREVFKKAILMSSCSIIIAHNHPSQDLEPSQEDILVTKQLKQASEILGIKLLDHLIFNKENFKSITEVF